MAKRPVFIRKDVFPFYEVKEVEFTFYPGFAISQKHKSIRSLHESFRGQADGNVLEISTKSDEALGVMLSAFNLLIAVNGRKISLECAFQGSKQFRNGGPYMDLYEVSSREAKKDARLKESGDLIGFNLAGKRFRSEPRDFFYNWIYIKALCDNAGYLRRLEPYSAFTDIEFNPQKSLNCQAKAVAIAMGLRKAGLLEQCMADEGIFLREVYRGQKPEAFEEMDLFAEGAGAC